MLTWGCGASLPALVLLAVKFLASPRRPDLSLEQVERDGGESALCEGQQRRISSGVN